MNAYHAELEFDWWERGQDFNTDMWRGRMSLRRVWLVIKNLPAESALGRKVNPEQWRAEHHILADLWDATVAVNWADEKKDPPRYPRPGAELAEKSKKQAMYEAWKAGARPKSRGD